MNRNVGDWATRAAIAGMLIAVIGLLEGCAIPRRISEEGSGPAAASGALGTYTIPSLVTTVGGELFRLALAESPEIGEQLRSGLIVRMEGLSAEVELPESTVVIVIDSARLGFYPPDSEMDRLVVTVLLVDQGHLELMMRSDSLTAEMGEQFALPGDSARVRVDYYLAERMDGSLQHEWSTARSKVRLTYRAVAAFAGGMAEPAVVSGCFRTEGVLSKAVIVEPSTTAVECGE